MTCGSEKSRIGLASGTRDPALNVGRTGFDFILSFNITFNQYL